MSAIYHQKDLDALVVAQLSSVLAYIAENPGKSLEAVATAVSVPYEVVFEIAQRANLLILPNSSGEIHWHAHKP